jgi:hypothetical protein
VRQSANLSVRRRLPRLLHCGGAEPPPLFDPATIIGALGVGIPLWRISQQLGKFEGRTVAILEGVQSMIKEHDERLRELETKRR